MGVPGQILEHLFGSAEGCLSVDDPLDLTGLVAQSFETVWLGQLVQLPVEAELALAEGLSQVRQEFPPEQGAEDAHVNQEGLSASDPPRAVRREAAARHHTVYMRVDVKVLSPGVQDAQKTDGGAQALGVCRNRQQGLGNGTKQNGVDLPGIL